MRPAEDIKRLIKNLTDKTSAQMDERVLEDVLFALEESEKTSALTWSNIRRTIMKSPITKLAVAAVIIITVFIGLEQLSNNGSSVAWADVAERFESVPFYSVVVYMGHDKSLPDGRIEIWKSEDGPVRVHTGNKVIFTRRLNGDTVAFDRSTLEPVDFNLSGIVMDLLENTLPAGEPKGLFSLDTLIDHFPVGPKGIARVETSDTAASKETILFEARHESSPERLLIWVLSGSKLPIQMRFRDPRTGEYGDFFFDYSERKDASFFDPEAFKSKQTNK